MTQKTCEKCDGAVAYFRLPGLFEFYGLYSLFLPLFYNHREYFYDWCEIGSIYGAPADCLWGGGRVGFGDDEAEKVLRLTQKYGISARLTFSNSLIKQEHLSDRKCNRLCKMFSESTAVMKMSAAKVFVRIARILYAVLPAVTRGTSFQRLWKTLRLSERTILKTPICRWGSISSK